MIQFLFIGVGLRIRLANTLGYDFCVALFVTRIFAIFTLHTRRILEEVPTKSTTHDVVELLKNKFMAVKFVNFFFALSDSTFTVKTNIKGSPVFDLFRCALLAYTPFKKPMKPY